MAERSCKTCGFYDKWLPSCGDCMLKPYSRRAAMLGDKPVPPSSAATMTADDETCDRWAPIEQVTAFVNDGTEPAAWAIQTQNP